MRRTTSQFLNFFGKQGLAGGLNVSDNPILVAPQQMTQAKNVLIGATLARKKRGGLDRYHLGSFIGTASYPTVASMGGSNNAIRGLTQYWRYGSATSESNDDLFLHQADKVWSIASRTSPAIDRTGALSLSTTGIPVYQVFEGILYFTNSETADGYNKWNGVASAPGDAEAATAPADGAGKYIRAHQGRMWMGGNPGFPYRLYYSSALDAEDWTTNGGSLDLTYNGDPDGITAIFPPFQGRLYVATRRTIYEITGSTPTDFVIRPVTNGIGCVSHNSVAATPNDIIFCSDRGVHSLKRLAVSDQSEVDFLSRDIQSLWTSLTNRSLLDRATARWEETTNSYVLTIASAGQQTQDTTLVYNLEFGVWTTFNDIDGRSVARLLLSNQSYIGFGREDGEIVFINPSSQEEFNGDGINFSFTSGKIYPDGAIDRQYKFRDLTIFASATRQSTLSIQWTVDGIDGQISGSRAIQLANDTDLIGSTFVLGTSRLGFGQFLPKTVTVDSVGYSFQLTISATGESDIEFYGYRLEVEDADTHNT